MENIRLPSCLESMTLGQQLRLRANDGASKDCLQKIGVFALTLQQAFVVMWEGPDDLCRLHQGSDLKVS